MPEPQITVLPGGERVVTERVPGVRSVALGFWIGAGSRHEPDSRAGVSHFIEHLLFRGSDRYDALTIAELFDAMGGELNAATSRENTVVYVRIPSAHLERALDVMIDMVFAPRFADLDSEREVVLEEIAMVDDTPHDLVHDLAGEVVFGTHPLGRPIIGRAQVIESVSRRALRAYHAGAYAGPNVVLSAAGKVNHDRLVELVAARRADGRERVRLVERALVGVPEPSTRFLQRRTEQYHLVLSGPGVARDDDRRFAATLLDAILGGSASSRLFQEIREKRGMAYSVYTFGSQYAETGQVGVYVGTREDNLPTCLDVCAEELRAVGAGELRPGELERAKEYITGRIALSLESMSTRMSRLGKALVADQPIMSIDETLRRIDAVTESEIAELATEVFAPEALSVVGIGPSRRKFEAAARRLNPHALARAA